MRRFWNWLCADDNRFGVVIGAGLILVLMGLCQFGETRKAHADAQTPPACTAPR